MKRIAFHFLFLLFCSSNFCFAQINFYAEASPLEVAKGEYVTYKITIENGEGEAGIKPPSFAGFKVLGAPTETSAKNIVVNGSVRKVVQSISLTYVLQPKAVGTYNIATCTATVGNKNYQSNAVQIVVTNKSSTTNQPINSAQFFDDIDFFNAPKRQEQFKDHVLRNGENNVQDRITNNMHFNLQLSKTSCYVGEPIVATYKLFTRLPTESVLEKFPSFNGASVIDMKDEFAGEEFVQEKFGGRLYNAYTICKAQLYPLQAGVLTIDGSTLNNKVNFAKYDANDAGEMLTENVNLVSKPQQLNVLPLPEKNKPQNFTGSVGNFTISTQVDKDIFTTSDMGKLVVTITGSGNMQLLTVPAIQWPAGFEVFEIKSEDNTVISTVPISGSKVFEIPFAINKVGGYIIPKIAFSFFNPATKKYETVQSNAIKLEITKGNGNLQKPNASLKAKRENVFSVTKLLGSIILLVLLGLSYYLFFIKKKRKVILEKIQQEIVEVEKPIFIASEKNYLEKAKNNLDNNETNAFYYSLKEELENFLALRYDVAKTAIHIGTIENTLDACNVNNELVIATKKLMQKIELELYTPFEKDNDLKSKYSMAQALVQEHILHKN